MRDKTILHALVTLTHLKREEQVFGDPVIVQRFSSVGAFYVFFLQCFLRGSGQKGGQRDEGGREE